MIMFVILIFYCRQEIETLQKQIEANKDGKFDKENTTLPLAETSLSELQFAIKKINSTLNEAMENSNTISKLVL